MFGIEDLAIFNQLVDDNLIIRIAFYDMNSLDLYQLKYIDIRIFLIITSNTNDKMNKPSDDQLRQAIDAIFNKYDTDKSGTLQDK